LIDSPIGGLEKRHKKESSSCTFLTCLHSSREKKLLSRPVSPQNVAWRHKTLDRVVQNKFDEIDIDIDLNDLFFNSIAGYWMATKFSPVE